MTTDTTTPRPDAGPRAPRWSWTAAATLCLGGLLAVVLRPTAPAREPSTTETADALASFDPAILDTVAAWVGPVRVSTVASMVLHVAVPALLVGTARGRRLLDVIGGRRATSWRGVAAVVVLTNVATAPLRWSIGWRHAGEFGFRTSSPTRFVLEALGEVALETALWATGVALLLWLVRRRPRDWVAVGTVLGTTATLVLVLVAPLVVTELLLRPEPLADRSLAARLEPVLDSSTVAASTIEVGAASVRTTRVNAFVTGVGPSRRVVLYDTLLDRPADHVEAVVAHELAHEEHRDVERAVLASALGVAGLLITVALARRWAVRRALRPSPAVAGAAVAGVVVVFQLATSPLVAWDSRRAEAAADHRALELTRDPAAVVSLHRGFVVADLADPTPPAWVRFRRSHPTSDQRIRAAVAFAEREGLDPVPAVAP